MWILTTCYKCNGSGNINENTLCDICNPYGHIIDILLKGLIMVEDNIEPITPPQSPR